jgi:hydrogenase maturation protein HypF
MQRRLIELHGIVQGVGMRPFAFRLATRLGLRGRVRNRAGGVLIDVEGGAGALRRFVDRLTAGASRFADIHTVRVARAAVRRYDDFRIVASAATDRAPWMVAPDLATCDACLADLLNEANRRGGYPFTTCTHCGPRFTIVDSLPYDRPRTTMATFPLCAKCRDEYENVRDRRFHAQPIACPACGPTLVWRAGDVARTRGAAALDAAVAALRSGAIVAIKGIGGYHLACDAADERVVQRLRDRKHRDAKPFAVMARDLQSARRLVRLTQAEAAVLSSPARPIVLAAKRASSIVAANVAPGTDTLGVLLPYTPLHHLLLRACGGPFVMTSGNRSEEPIAFRDDDAFFALRDVADGFLLHDRPIQTRCDDSVVRVRGEAADVSFLRRSRGFAPRPLRVAEAWPVPVLALGGHLKNVFCLAKDRYAFLSPHIGDLDHPDTRRALADGIEHYCRLFGITPAVVVHDRHPEYATTRAAESLAGDAPRLAVQHHHAHVASCVAEHGVTEPVIGVVFDGAGLGDDGAIWGGEFLVAEGAGFERLAHLAYVPLPGGDAAAREPWRMAVAHLWTALGADFDRCQDALPFFAGLDPAALRLVLQLLHRRGHAPPTSSVGRLFDAVAALVGVAATNGYEAQAAIALERLAAASGSTRGAGGASYPVEIRDDGAGWIIDPAPLFRAIAHDLLSKRPRGAIASAFHQALADLVAATTGRIARRTGIRRVALTGGVFQNARLERLTARALRAQGFDVLVHRKVPCNDGGLALGQALIAGRMGGGVR